MPLLTLAGFRLPRGARADAMLAGGVFVVVALGAEGQRLTHGGDSTPSLIASWLLITAVCGALLLRRRYPVTAGWFTVSATGAYYLLSDIDGPLIMVPIVAMYAIAAQGRMRAAIAMAATVVIGLAAATLVGDTDVNGTAVFMLTGWLVAVIALGACDTVGCAYAEEEARRRATEERLRIARELHDVLGHHLSLINVQAGAALHRSRSDPDAGRGGAHRDQGRPARRRCASCGRRSACCARSTRRRPPHPAPGWTGSTSWSDAAGRPG